MRYRRLDIPGIAPMGIAVIANMVCAEGVHKTEGAVINGEPEDRHIVGVHHPMAETGSLPISHHNGRTSSHLTQHTQYSLLRTGRLPRCSLATFRKMAVYYVVRQGT